MAISHVQAKKEELKNAVSALEQERTCTCAARAASMATYTTHALYSHLLSSQACSSIAQDWNREVDIGWYNRLPEERKAEAGQIIQERHLSAEKIQKQIYAEIKDLVDETMVQCTRIMGSLLLIEEAEEDNQDVMQVFETVEYCLSLLTAMSRQQNIALLNTIITKRKQHLEARKGQGPIRLMQA